VVEFTELYELLTGWLQSIYKLSIFPQVSVL